MSNVGLFQMEEFADNNLKFYENGGEFSKRVQNTMGKGEIARYEQFFLFPRNEQFLLYPQCFQKTCTGDT